MLVNQRSRLARSGLDGCEFRHSELASRLEYRKGPYFCQRGRFRRPVRCILIAMPFRKALPSLGVGQNGYRRALITDSPAFADGRLFMLH